MVLNLTPCIPNQGAGKILRRIVLSIISEMVLFSKYTYNRKCPLYDIHDPFTNYNIKTINRNQRIRWRKKKIVPWQILLIFSAWGFDLGYSEKKLGISLSGFLERLWRFSSDCSDEKTKAAAVYLYQNTIKFEF